MKNTNSNLSEDELKTMLETFSMTEEEIDKECLELFGPLTDNEEDLMKMINDLVKNSPVE